MVARSPKRSGADSLPSTPIARAGYAARRSLDWNCGDTHFPSTRATIDPIGPPSWRIRDAKVNVRPGQYAWFVTLLSQQRVIRNSHAYRTGT